MKVVINDKDFNESINFIDRHDMFLGFDLSQCCCEETGWFVHDSETPSDDFPASSPVEELEGYYFNPFPIEDSPVIEAPLDYSSDDVESQHVCFEIYHDTKEVKYLHIYNYHNGYYGHEFILKRGETIIAEQQL